MTRPRARQEEIMGRIRGLNLLDGNPLETAHRTARI
jgi:hypothetical protein